MLSANFKPKTTAAVSRGSLTTARLSCYHAAWTTAIHCYRVFLTVSCGKVQPVQNAAARLITGARRRDHITLSSFALALCPATSDPQWLKLACLVHQSLSGHTPAYLADDIRLLSEFDRRQLRSSAKRPCVVASAHNSYGVCGSACHLTCRNHISYNDFERQLKTCLFYRPQRSALWHLFSIAL